MANKPEGAGSITVYFTQCCVLLQRCDFCLKAESLPIETRLKMYEDKFFRINDSLVVVGGDGLIFPKGDQVYATYDEHLILVLQAAARKKLRHYAAIHLVDVCSCFGSFLSKDLDLDEEGDLVGNCQPHGFFNQRLRYLR